MDVSENGVSPSIARNQVPEHDDVSPVARQTNPETRLLCPKKKPLGMSSITEGKMKRTHCRWH